MKKNLINVEPKEIKYPFHVRYYSENVWMGDGIVVKHNALGWHILTTRNFSQNNVIVVPQGENWELCNYDYPERKLKLLREMWDAENRCKSVIDVTHFTYVELKKCGWPMLPFLLSSLKRNKASWFELMVIGEILPYVPWGEDTRGSFDKMREKLLEYAEGTLKLI